MSVFQPGNVAYGLSQALIGVPPSPIISKRDPTIHDRAEIGTIWIDQPNNLPYILTSIVDNVATWVSIESGAAITSVITDSGIATPIFGVLGIVGGANIITSALNNIVTVAVTENINLPATNAAGTQGIYEIGGLHFAFAYPPSNTFVGITAGNTTLNSVSAINNTGIGNNSLHVLTLGDNNTGVGANSLVAATTGSDNSAFGLDSCQKLTTGSFNVSLGSASLGNLITGSLNISVGALSGVNYDGAESSNITIGNQGVLGESNVIRIGTQGSGAAQQDACAIAGIYNTPVGVTQQIVFVDSNGFLGSYPGTDGQVIIGATAGAPLWSTLTAGTNITITNAANSITINGAGSGITTLDGDSGSATGATVTLNAATNCGSTVNFLASGATVDLRVTDSGNANTIMGLAAGNGTISGTDNTSFGENTLHALTSGGSNTALGLSALVDCTTSSGNTAVGQGTLFSVATGSGHNTAVGITSLNFITTGSNNIALGASAATSYTTTESSNIIIGNSGTIGESNVIRIGTQGAGAGEQDSCFIAGIAGVTVANSAAVLIDTTSGELGTVASSRRYKENIEDMESASNNIMNLRPVIFHMKNDPTKRRHYGLIAEEVDTTFPDLVTYNIAQDPETVRYHDLPVLLLNELQKQHNVIAMLQSRIQALENKGRYESTR